MRTKIKQYGGYEIRTQGDSFVLAFQDPLSAAKFCMEAQEELHRIEWDETFTAMHPSVSLVLDKQGRKVFSGLRVRMGIHTGTPDFCEPDATSGRMDYFGPAMNLAARVGSIPFGGQVI